MDIFGPAFWVAFAVCAGAALATMLGGLVVLMAKQPSPKLLSFGLAFAGGAMVYVSLVEIFIKSQASFSQVYDAKMGYTAATLAFFAGVVMLILLDRAIPHPHGSMQLNDNRLDDAVKRAQLNRMGLLTALAITAHNFPEGLATFFATYDNPVVGMPLALAIAVHNIPEGVSIAIPIYVATGSRNKALIACGLSALAEPAGALLGYLVLAPFLSPWIYGAVFGVIAGVMVFLALDELLPAAKRYAEGHQTVYGMISGMVVMAISLVLFK